MPVPLDLQGQLPLDGLRHPFERVSNTLDNGLSCFNRMLTRMMPILPLEPWVDAATAGAARVSCDRLVGVAASQKP